MKDTANYNPEHIIYGDNMVMSIKGEQLPEFDFRVISDEAKRLVDRMNAYVKLKCWSYGFSPAEMAEKIVYQNSLITELKMYNSQLPVARRQEKIICTIGRSGYCIDISYSA